MKTADDILKMIQFDLKHHQRLSEDSLEAISQFKADGRGKEKSETVWFIENEAGEWYWSQSANVINDESFEWGWTVDPNKALPCKSKDGMEKHLEFLRWIEQKRDEVVFANARVTEHEFVTSPLKPISESKGETGWTKDQMRSMLEDVVTVLDLSDDAIEKHGPLGTPPAELVKLVLEQKDHQIRMLKVGMTQIEPTTSSLRSSEPETNKTK